MSQPRRDRPVVGGRRATAGGRAQALRARGYNEARAWLRAGRVFELHQEGRTFRAIAETLGISKSQAQRDHDSIWCRSAPNVHEEIVGDKLLRLRQLGREQGERWTYPRLAKLAGICERQVGDLVRAAQKRAAMRDLMWDLLDDPPPTPNVRPHKTCNCRPVEDKSTCHPIGTCNSCDLLIFEGPNV